MLKYNNEELEQKNDDLNNENSLLKSGKLLLENELKLIDNKNSDANNQIKELEFKLDVEKNSKETEKLTNHGLYQNEIDLVGKMELLEKEIACLNTT